MLFCCHEVAVITPMSLVRGTFGRVVVTKKIPKTNFDFQNIPKTCAKSRTKRSNEAIEHCSNALIMLGAFAGFMVIPFRSKSDYVGRFGAIWGTFCVTIALLEGAAYQLGEDCSIPPPNWQGASRWRWWSRWFP